MAYQRVTVVVAGSHADVLCDAFGEAGAISTEVADADEGTERERAFYAEPGADLAAWPRCRVSALFPAGHDVARALDRALAACGIEALAAASVDRVEDADWVALTQRQFEPIRAGERLWIVPTWHAPPEPGALNVVAATASALKAADAPAMEQPVFERLDDADWVALTQRQFAPIRVGERLWIVPSWHETPDPGAINVALDPGAARSAASFAASNLAPVSSSGKRSSASKPLKTWRQLPQRTCPCFAFNCCGVTRKRDRQCVHVVISIAACAAR